MNATGTRLKDEGRGNNWLSHFWAQSLASSCKVSQASLEQTFKTMQGKKKKIEWNCFPIFPNPNHCILLFWKLACYVLFKNSIKKPTWKC